MAEARGINPTYPDFRSLGRDAGKLGAAKPQVEELLLSFTPNSGPLTDLSFHSFVPVPVEVQRSSFDPEVAKVLPDLLDSNEVSPVGGYTWQNHNWGTKWGVEFVHKQTFVGGEPTEKFLESAEGDITIVKYYFDSAWSPPIPVAEAISVRFPESRVTLEFEERGNWFAGRNTYEGGTLIKSESWDPPELDEDY